MEMNDDSREEENEKLKGQNKTLRKQLDDALEQNEILQERIVRQRTIIRGQGKKGGN